MDKRPPSRSPNRPPLRLVGAPAGSESAGGQAPAPPCPPPLSPGLPALAMPCATNFSFLRGASHPDEMVFQAARLGWSAIAVADRNTLSGVVRAHKAAKEARIGFVPGARLVTQEGFELAAFPTDREAYGRLCALLTLGNRRAPKGECWLTPADILAHAQGQILLVIPPAALTPAWERAARAFCAAAPEPDGLFMALTRPLDGADHDRLERLAALAEDQGIRCAAALDALYHVPERRDLADVIACIREDAVRVDEAGLLVQANAERHIKSPEETARLFAGYDEAIAATHEILARCRFSLDALRYDYPDEVLAPGETPMQTFRRLVEAGARQRWPEGVPAPFRAALDHEYGLIEELDYAKYFLTVYDLVAFARSRGILCQGRGSAANSIACYCLGITSVDPAKVDLLFERFVSAERGEPPDIDVDFEHERREEVIQYIYQRYGRERAGIAATVITYRARSAVREVGKVMGLSADTVEALAKTVWGWSSKGVGEQHVRDELGLDPEEPRLRRTLELTRELIGFPRHLSQHTGGFVITRSPLHEVVPIGNAAMENRTFVEWDKDDLDALGMLKIDVLALGMLTCVARAFDLLDRHYGRRLGLATVPAEDPRVYDMICEADTLGVFQIESRAQMSMLPRLKPRCYYDLVIEVAIVRPGPIQGDMVHPYLRRRSGQEEVEFPSDELRGVLGKTLGVPLFQEQAMRVAIVAAGFTPSEADRLRRAMATFRKTGIIHEFGKRLVDGMVANGYEREFAERCFKQIEGFGEYGFPESHAASFALIVYVSCWLKRHYPDVFLAAMLNAQPLGFYAPAQLVRDAREHGVEARPPDVNFSQWDAVLEARRATLRAGPVSDIEPEPDSEPEEDWKRRPFTEEGGKAFAVRLGLRQIKGFSEADAARIAAAREAGGPFQTVAELQRRARLEPAAIERLADADCFGSLGLGRRQALWEARALKAKPPPLLVMAGEAGAEEPAALPLMPQAEEVAYDYATLRLSLKAHPMAFFRARLMAEGAVSAEELWRVRNNGRADLAGLVLVRQRPGTAKGVIFATLEDETGAANIIIWPKVFERFRPEVMTARVMRIKGRVQREGQVMHLIADRVEDVSVWLGDLTSDVEFGEPYAHADEVKNQGGDPRAAVLEKAAARAERQAALTPKGERRPASLPDPVLEQIQPNMYRTRGERRALRTRRRGGGADAVQLPRSRDFH